MPINAGLLDTRIPMSAKPAPVDIPGSIHQGMLMRGDMLKVQQQEQQINDQKVVQDYLQAGGDIYTPPGSVKALEDLKGKISAESYMKLTAHANQMRDKDVEYRKDLAALSTVDLGNKSKVVDNALGFMTQSLQAYEKAAGTAGQQQAMVDFEKAKQASMAQAAQMKDSAGNPMFSPEELQQYAAATPEQMKMLWTGTKYGQSIIHAQLQEAQTKAATALAERRNAIPSEEFTGPDGSRYQRERDGTTYKWNGQQWVRWEAGLPAGVKALTGAGSTSRVKVGGGAGGSGGGGGATASAVSKKYGTDPEYAQKVDFWAGVLANGGTLPPRFAHSGAGKEMYSDIVLRVPDMTPGPKDMMANTADFAGAKAGSRTAGQRAANFGIAKAEAYEMADLVTQASEKYARTEFMPLNKVFQMVDKNTGDVEVRKFGAALNSFINAYARAVSPIGTPTVHDKQHAREMLSTADSHQQVTGIIAQLKREMEAAERAPATVRRQIRGSILGIGEEAAPTRQEAPKAALEYLKQHPELREQFRAKYGYVPD